MAKIGLTVGMAMHTLKLALYVLCFTVANQALANVPCLPGTDPLLCDGPPPWQIEERLRARMVVGDCRQANNGLYEQMTDNGLEVIASLDQVSEDCTDQYSREETEKVYADYLAEVEFQKNFKRTRLTCRIWEVGFVVSGLEGTCVDGDEVGYKVKILGVGASVGFGFSEDSKRYYDLDVECSTKKADRISGYYAGGKGGFSPLFPPYSMKGGTFYGSNNSSCEVMGAYAGWSFDLSAAVLRIYKM